MTQDSLMVVHLMCLQSSALRYVSVVSSDASMDISACSSIFAFVRCWWLYSNLDRLALANQRSIPPLLV